MTMCDLQLYYGIVQHWERDHGMIDRDEDHLAVHLHADDVIGLCVGKGDRVVFRTMRDPQDRQRFYARRVELERRGDE